MNQLYANISDLELLTCYTDLKTMHTIFEIYISPILNYFFPIIMITNQITEFEKFEDLLRKAAGNSPYNGRYTKEIMSNHYKNILADQRVELDVFQNTRSHDITWVQAYRNVFFQEEIHE